MMRTRTAVLAAAAALLTACTSGTMPFAHDSGAQQAFTCLEPVRPSASTLALPTDANGRVTGCRSEVMDDGPPGPTSPASPTRTATPPWTGTRAEQRFAWAQHGYLESGATVTLVRSITPRAALGIVISKLRHGRIQPAARGSLAGTGSAEEVRAGARPGGWTLVVEENGYQATDHSILRRLSAHGEAIVIFTNVEADASFQYAVGGRIRREFDPLLFGSASIGRALPEERGIHFGDERDMNPMAQSFLLAYRLTGLALTERDLVTRTRRLAVQVDY